MKKIKGVLIDIDKKKVSVEEIDNTFTAVHKILNDSVFHTIVRRKIGKNIYDIICDYEGLLHPSAYKRVSAMSLDGSNLLVGNIFVCNENWNKDGLELETLTESQVEEVKLAIHKQAYDGSPVLIMV